EVPEPLPPAPSPKRRGGASECRLPLSASGRGLGGGVKVGLRSRDRGETDMFFRDRSTNTLFRDRSEAGRVLAEQLKEYADRSDVIVLALPRGGVPVGYE